MKRTRRSIHGTRNGFAAAAPRGLPHAVADAKRSRATLERALVLHFYRYGDPLVVAALDEPFIAALGQLLGDATADPPRPLRAFVLFEAVRGAILAASLVAPASIEDGNYGASSSPSCAAT
jgi:hypothetical protein